MKKNFLKSMLAAVIMLLGAMNVSALETYDFQELCMKLGKGGPWAVNDGGDAGFTIDDATMHFLGDYTEQGFTWNQRFAYEYVDGRGKFTMRNKNNKKDKNCGMFSWDYTHYFSILDLKDGDKVTITTLAGTTSFVSTNVVEEVSEGATVASGTTYTIATTEGSTRLDIQMAAATLISKIEIEPYGVETVPIITVTPKTLALIPTATAKLTANVSPVADTQWSSSDENVVTVATDGTVTAIAAGTAFVINSWQSAVSDATASDTCEITVADVDLSAYSVVKSYDFTTMGDVTLELQSEAAGAIWNEANSKNNNVFFCTNEGLENIAVQAAVSSNKGWSIVDGQGLFLASGAGRCAAIGGIKAGQIVEFIYTGDGFYTRSDDDGIDKTALNEAIGRAIYQADEDGMIGFELVKGNAVKQIIIYELPPIYIETDLTSKFNALTVASNWKNIEGGKAAYTATNFCPVVTTNAGQTVQVCEYYRGSCDYTGEVLSQTVTGLAPGTYKIELYGAAAFTFGRGFGSTAFTGDLSTDNNSEYSAGDHIDSETGVTLYAETSNGTYGGEIPIYYATNFPDGAAVVTLSGVEVGENGEVKIGMSKTSTSTNWHVIQLKGVTAQVNAFDLLASYQEQAAELLAMEMSAAVKETLEKAAQTKKGDLTEENAKRILDAFAEAIDAANVSITANATLSKMKELVESTNVYTQEAYEEYYGLWYQKYEAGTLTKDEAGTLQDPFVVTGWHASITCDDFLLSAWDTNPDFNNAPYYINTWSTEGNNDDSGFVVPFFEYWTGDGDSLGERTLTATMNGLQKGVYNVTALVRVRIKNGAEAPAYGISLQANEGEAVDVCTGEQYGQMYLKEYKATGNVADDGVLNIKFIVAANNNVSWLSFKNVKFEFNAEATGISSIAADNVAADGIFNLAGQKVRIAQKGFFIINGKKVVK